jgi:CHASE2 domain-containing sensor protein/tRNA A-37 threonylcarbamoyl transferase component Bud32
MAAIGLAAASLGALSRSAGTLSWAEQLSIDLRFSVRGTIAPSTHVVVVALNTESYLELPRPPLPRTLDAQLVERLSRAGARVVAFDLSLERPGPSAPADFDLIKALRRAPSAVVSVTGVYRSGGTAPLAGRIPFADTEIRPGVTLLALDSDGTVRRFPPDLGGVESFALAGARAYDQRVSASVPGGALIDYPGPSGTLPSVSFADVLSGHFPARAVRGKVVVVGETAPVLQDIHRTPVSAAMPGPEIQADAIATALNGYPLRSWSTFEDDLILLCVGLAVPGLAVLQRLIARPREPHTHGLASPGPDAIAVLVAGFLMVAGWSVASQVAFNHGTVLDYSDAVLTIVLAATASWVFAEVLERHSRRKIRRLFAASVPEVVQHVLGSSGGSRVRVSSRGVIAGYQLEEVIGRGGMGVVYRASQIHLQRPVALKLIRNEFADSALYRARFQRESRLAAAVSHPNVIPVLDAGEDDGLLFLAMQLVTGINLARILTGGGTLAVAEAAEVVRQIAGALDALHSEALVHRDVKPANIMLRAGDPEQALLTDFGLAKSYAGGDELTQAEGWAGTVDYLAPEQFQGGRVDHRADIYALTAVLYHCLTGSVPFPRDAVAAKIAAHLNSHRPLVLRLRPEMPKAIDAVICRGMAVSPGDRYASAGELATHACAALGIRIGRREAPPTAGADEETTGDRAATRVSDQTSGRALDVPGP